MSKPSRRNPLKIKKELRSTMESARRDFNKCLMNLINIACGKNQRDDNLQQVKEIFVSIQAAEPSIIITGAGPYIWKYRDQLATKNSDFFLQNTFQNDIEEYQTTTNESGIPEESFSEGEIDAVMRSFKHTWHLLTPPEKTVIWKHAGGLLKFYAQYLGCEKKLEKINKEIQKMRK